MKVNLKMIAPMFIFALLGCDNKEDVPVPEEDGPTEQLERLSEEELRALKEAVQAEWEREEKPGEIRAVQYGDPLLRN